MKRSLFSLGLACFAVAAALPASAQINTGGLLDLPHGPYNLAEAYPCVASTYPVGTPEERSLTALQTFHGICASGAPAPGAAPGILCLKRPTDANGVPTSLALDVNCFVTIPSGQTGPCFVQAFRLFKMVPGSFKCPDVYGTPHFDGDGNLLPYTYVQFGSGVRTWWSLNFTQPGTRFLLQVVSVCHVPQPTMTTTSTNTETGVTTTTTVPVPGTVATSAIHVDSWRWRVVANGDTLLQVIYLMHQGAVSTLEVPCIIGEDMYDALLKAVGTHAVGTTAGTGLLGAIDEPTTVSTSSTSSTSSTVTNTSRTADIGNAIFNMEALIVANCLFVEVLNPLVAFPGPPQFGMPNITLPANSAPMVSFGTQGSAVAGIIDTIEHPCCCKLLVDLEWISIRNGIIGFTTPKGTTLPTF